MVKTPMFEIKVESLFHMKGQGSVLSGRILSGTVTVGSFVEICSPAQTTQSQIAGLEADQQSIYSAKVGENVAVLLKTFVPEEVSDGLKQDEFGNWQVLHLNICGKSKPWWNFWS